MAFFKAALFALALRLSIVNAQANACTSSKYKSYISLLSTYTSALSYCSTSYPVAPVVSTTTSFVKKPVTVTDTTSTVTVTETASAAKKVRRQAPSSRSAAFASLTKQAPTFQKTVCSCIETPTTVVSTTKVTKGRTTIHTTATTTTTTTVSPTPSPLCSTGEYTTNGDPNQSFQIKCGYIYQSDSLRYQGPATDIYDCANQCFQFNQGTSLPHCCGITFDRGNLNCFILIPGTPTTCPTDAESPDARAGYDVGVPEGVPFGD